MKCILVLTASALLTASTAVQAATLAYTSPVGTAPSQNFPNSFGMDFDVNRPIAVTALGLYDAGGDGFAGDNFATLFNRDNGAVVAQLEFGGTTGDGTLLAGTLDRVGRPRLPRRSHAHPNEIAAIPVRSRFRIDGVSV